MIFYLFIIGCVQCFKRRFPYQINCREFRHIYSVTCAVTLFITGASKDVNCAHKNSVITVYITTLRRIDQLLRVLKTEKKLVRVINILTID